MDFFFFNKGAKTTRWTKDSFSANGAVTTGQKKSNFDQYYALIKLNSKCTVVQNVKPQPIKLLEKKIFLTIG